MKENKLNLSLIDRICAGSGLLEKVREVADYFSRPGKRMENEDKVWKKF